MSVAFFRVCVLLCLVSASSTACADEQLTTQHRSHIRVRDPYILADEQSQTYYLYVSTANRYTTEALKLGVEQQGVDVYSSKDLEMWTGPVTAFELPENFWADQAVWAPEVHKYRDKYYMFVTFTSDKPLETPVGRPPNVKRGTQILVADSPVGPFQTFANEPQTPKSWMSLDGTFWLEDDTPWMVFCHEWIQITDGSMELVQLTDDLSKAVGQTKTLFRASEADWVRCRGDIGEKYQGKRYHAYITDGCFLYRTKTDKLLMIWSSYGEQKYAVGQAISTTGKITGPWEQIQEPLFKKDGGHGMIFKTFSGQLVLVIHQPNRETERVHYFALEDSGDQLTLTGEILDFAQENKKSN